MKVSLLGGALFFAFVALASNRTCCKEQDPLSQTQHSLKVAVESVGKVIDFAQKLDEQGQLKPRLLLGITIEHLEKKSLLENIKEPPDAYQIIDNLNNRARLQSGEARVLPLELRGKSEKDTLLSIRRVWLWFAPLSGGATSITFVYKANLFRSVDTWTYKFEDIQLSDRGMTQTKNDWTVSIEKVEMVDQPPGEVIEKPSPTPGKWVALWIRAESKTRHPFEITWHPIPLSVDERDIKTNRVIVRQFIANYDKIHFLPAIGAQSPAEMTGFLVKYVFKSRDPSSTKYRFGIIFKRQAEPKELTFTFKDIPLPP